MTFRTCKGCGWRAVLGDYGDYCLDCEPGLETFEDTIGCDMCGSHIDDPCDCFDPQSERRYRPNPSSPPLAPESERHRTGGQ